MTEERQDIPTDFYAGNSKNIRITVVDKDDQPFSLTSCEVTYSIFDDKGVVYVLKNSLQSSEVEKTNPPNSHICTVHLLPNDTSKLSGVYRHMLNVVDITGQEETVMTGTIHIWKSFARRYRSTSIKAYLSGV